MTVRSMARRSTHATKTLELAGALSVSFKWPMVLMSCNHGMEKSKDIGAFRALLLYAIVFFVLS